VSDKRPIDEPSGIETTGHEWDGIRELDNPLPRWWLYILYATIIFAVGYTIAYPSIPLIERAWPGALKWSSRQELVVDMAATEKSRAAMDAQLASRSFEEIAADTGLMDYAQRSGASAFKIVCVQCHGSGAQGSQELGYPNLNDDAWLWGGTMDAIYNTISHGVRNTEDPDARNSAMPAYGALGILDRNQISDVSDHVRALAGLEHDEAASERGAETFATQCAACHGADGEGNPLLGAPRLADAIWLYGAEHEQIMAQVANPRMGVMPPWAQRFDEATRKKLAIYIHSLGGGE